MLLLCWELLELLERVDDLFVLVIENCVFVVGLLVLIDSDVFCDYLEVIGELIICVDVIIMTNCNTYCDVIIWVVCLFD